jgi:hypothetical protein
MASAALAPLACARLPPTPGSAPRPRHSRSVWDNGAARHLLTIGPGCSSCRTYVLLTRYLTTSGARTGGVTPLTATTGTTGDRAACSSRGCRASASQPARPSEEEAGTARSGTGSQGAGRSTTSRGMTKPTRSDESGPRTCLRARIASLADHSKAADAAHTVPPTESGSSHAARAG